MLITVLEGVGGLLGWGADFVAGFMRFLSLGIMLKLYVVRNVGRGRPRPCIAYFAAPVIWSNTPPSVKWVFWAFCQPPKASSMVKSFSLASLVGTFLSIGR